MDNRTKTLSASQPPSCLDALVHFALSEGAGNVRIIAAVDIPVEDQLAKLCDTCPNRGFSYSCPPHVAGPAEFRRLQKYSPWAVVVQLLVPMSALFSGERKELGRYHHELLAGIEIRARGMGYMNSRAFAGGSCKSIFCHDHPQCRRLAGGPCRHPEHARPSMSGFGINVTELMKRCGWPSDLNRGKNAVEGESMSWLGGLVLIAPA